MKILVVDDERDIEPLFMLKFRKEIKRGEIELIFAFSGSEAVDRLRETELTDVVLILSDINMPGMTGFELLKHIKDVPIPVPVCMMTAYDNDEYRGRASALDCDGFVSKPIDFGALKDQIRNWVGE